MLEVTGSSNRSEKSTGSLIGRPVVVLTAIVLLLLLVNANILDNEFLNWDDDLYVTENPRVQAQTLSEVWEVFDPGDAMAGGFVEYFPLRDLFYALTYYGFGIERLPYHLLQVFLHVCVCLLLFACVRKWLGDQVGLFSAAVFAFHPVHVESIAWISALKDPLFSVFLLSSILFYWRYREGSSARLASYLVSIVCLVLSLLCKSFGVVLPALLLLLDLTFSNRRKLRELIVDKIPFVLVVFVALTAFVFIGRANNVIVNYPGGSPLTGFLTMVTVFVRYLGKLVAPINLTPRYVVDPIQSFVDPLFLSSSFIIIAIVVAVFVFWKRSPIPLFAFGWFLLCILPVMNIVPIPIEMADRYLYFPSIGFSVAFGVLANKLLGFPGNLVRISVFLVTIGTILGFSWLSVLANDKWQNDIVLWTHVIELAPEFYIGHNNLAYAYGKRNESEKAFEHMEASLKLNPRHAPTHQNLGEMLRRQGHTERAKQEFLLAVKYKPKFAKAFNSLGAIYMDQQKFQEAVKFFKAAIGVRPNYSTAYRNWSMVCLSQGDNQCAVEKIELAMGSSPHSPILFLDLMKVLKDTGRAREMFKWQYLIDHHFRDHPILWFNWGMLAQISGDLETAKKAFKHVLVLEPGNANARRALDKLNRTQKRRSLVNQ